MVSRMGAAQRCEVTMAPAVRSLCPPEVLGGRVHDDVGPQGERLLENGSREGVVHDHGNLALWARCGERCNVSTAQGWVGGGFQEKHSGLAR